MAVEDDIRAFLEENGPKYLEEVGFPWFRCPSISSGKNPNIEGIAASAEHVRGALQNLGLEAEIINVEGINPLVFAQTRQDPERRTVLFYGHGDVKSVRPEAWNTPPFDPTFIDGKLYGRGVADDKGQTFALMLGVLAAKEVKGGELPVNVKFLIEHNEETGLPDELVSWMGSHRELLAADGYVIADCEQYDDSGSPTFIRSLKGISAVELMMNKRDAFGLARLVSSLYDTETRRVALPGFYKSVDDRGPIRDEHILQLLADPNGKILGKVLTPEIGCDQATHRGRRPTYDPLALFFADPHPVRDEVERTIKITARGPPKGLHSGSFGGPVQNPGLYLARATVILESLRNLGLGVSIDYIAYGESNDFLKTNISPTGEMQVTIYGGDSRDIAESVEVYVAGVWTAGDAGLFDYEMVDRDHRIDYLERECFKEGQFSTPRAGLSFRLVPNQDPNVVHSTLNQLVALHGATLGESHQSKPFIADSDSLFCKTFSSAAENYYGKPALHFEEGGSIGIALELGKMGPVLLCAYGPKEARAHNPNEWVRVGDLMNGAGATALSLLRFGEE
ncbi:MAG: M20/M25/M40 family metallo-hydrolase [archaeon]